MVLVGSWMERVVYQERVSVEYLAVEEVEVRVMVCGVVVGVGLLLVSVNWILNGSDICEVPMMVVPV